MLWVSNVCVGGYKCEWGSGASGIVGGGHEHATSAVGCVEAVLLLLLPPLLLSETSSGWGVVCCLLLNVGAVCGCELGVVGVVLPPPPPPASLEAFEFSSCCFKINIKYFINGNS